MGERNPIAGGEAKRKMKWSRRELNPESCVYKTLTPTWRPLLAIRGRAAYLLPNGDHRITRLAFVEFVGPLRPTRISAQPSKLHSSYAHSQVRSDNA